MLQEDRLMKLNELNMDLDYGQDLLWNVLFFKTVKSWIAADYFIYPLASKK